MVRVLLDNCVPRKLARHLVGHELATVIELGWAGFDDGLLLDSMAGQFDVLVTVDKSIPYQQAIGHRPIALVILRAKSNNIRDLLPLIPELLQQLATVTPGEVRTVTPSGN